VLELGDRSRLPYCVMTASGVLENTSDTLAGRSGACPTLFGGAIDHLYATIGMPVIDLVRVPTQPPATSPATDLVSHCSDTGPCTSTSACRRMRAKHQCRRALCEDTVAPS
jgi:hypothetical protein